MTTTYDDPGCIIYPCKQCGGEVAIRNFDLAGTGLEWRRFKSERAGYGDQNPRVMLTCMKCFAFGSGTGWRFFNQPGAKTGEIVPSGATLTMYDGTVVNL